MKTRPSKPAARASRRTRPSRRPFVLMNMSMTADGKIATANRVVSSFSSARDRHHLHALRATADAVICGARTVDLNRVTLGTGGAKFRKLRLRRGLAEHNLRIIVSGSGSIKTDAHIFTQKGSPITDALGDGVPLLGGARGGLSRRFVAAAGVPGGPILILTTAKAGAHKLKQLRAVATEVKIFGQTELNLRAALTWLHRQWGVNRLLCEGGGELNDALFRAGLVDELHLTLCPRLIGGRSAPTIVDGTGFQRLADAAQLELKSARRVGDELFLVYQVNKRA